MWLRRGPFFMRPELEFKPHSYDKAHSFPWGHPNFQLPVSQILFLTAHNDDFQNSGCYAWKSISGKKCCLPLLKLYLLHKKNNVFFNCWKCKRNSQVVFLRPHHPSQIWKPWNWILTSLILDLKVMFVGEHGGSEWALIIIFWLRCDILWLQAGSTW